MNYSDCWTYPKEQIDEYLKSIYDKIDEAEARTNEKINHISKFTIETIADETDLNNVLTPGFYGVGSSASASSLLNCPASVGFSLIVMKKGGEGYELQILTTGLNMYTRVRTSSGWSKWKTYTNSDVS